MSDADIIRRLREENDELRERLRQFEERNRERLGYGTFPRSWKITPTMKSILIDLSSGAIVHPLDLWQNAAERYPTSVGYEKGSRTRLDGGPSDPIAVIRVQITRSRKTLTEYAVEICSKWGEGYYLSPESLEIVRSALGRGSARSDQQEQEQ